MSVQAFHRHLHENLTRHLFGLDETILWLTVAFIARGHALLEGYPGTGKTSLARALAQSLGGSFGRIQCTADLMPSDMTGIRIYNEANGTFELMQGPLFSDVVIVDEINRTSPKTQSAMLEAMEERRITIDRESYELPPEFFVIATQNPHEFEGTYPLPESQIDRFLIKLGIEHPPAEEEIEVMKTYGAIPASTRTREAVATPIDPALTLAAREEANAVQVSDPVYDYVEALAIATRNSPQVSLGLSTRGALALIRCARVLAAMDDMTFITPDHIKHATGTVVAHRLILTQDALFDGVVATDVVAELIDNIPVPRQ